MDTGRSRRDIPVLARLSRSDMPRWLASLGPVIQLLAAVQLRAFNIQSIPAGVLAMVRSVLRLRGWNRGLSIRIDTLDPGRVAVILCTWGRLERLPRTLELLAAQDIAVQVLIWDNSGQAELVDKAVSEARLPVAVHHSNRNVGGFGRFYLARAAAEGGHQAVVFVDDDLEFEPGTVRELLSLYKPKSISARWAFRFTGRHYYTRERCGPGEAAHYLGTGGMVADAAVFTDPRLFACPRRFWFVEDLWLCFVAQHLNGYALSSSSDLVQEVHDGRGQWVSLWFVKDMLRHYTARRGWLRPSVLRADGTTFLLHRELPGNASRACPLRTDGRRRPRG